MKHCKVIQTKYFGPTNFKGSRVKATDDNGNSVTIGWDSVLDVEHNHTKAAQALLKKIGDKSPLTIDQFTELVLDSMGSFNAGYMFTAIRKTFTKGSNNENA